MKATFKIDRYHVVLPHIQNIYGVEKDNCGYFWGFKYSSGVFEYFSYKTEREAKKVHDSFIEALNLYYKK